MSTKIYDAYKVEKKIKELLPIFIEIAPKIKEICKRNYLKDIYELAVFDFDKNDKKTFEELKEYYFKEYSKDRFNNGLLAMLFPQKKDTYMLFFGKTSLVKEINKNIELVDFHYQNSTDKPDDIHEDEWIDRLAVWDKILGGDGYGRPIDYGLQFTFAEKNPAQYYDFLATKNIELPSKEKRAKRLVFWDNRKNIWGRKIYSNIMEFEKSDEFKKLVAEKIKNLKQIS